MVIKLSKTVKELADEFGVSKQAIRKQLTENFRSNYVKTVTSNGIDLLLVNDKGYTLLKEHLKKETPGGNSTGKVTSNQVTSNEFLNQQIIIKDKQLLAKDEEIKQLQKLLDHSQNLIDQEQQLHLADQKRIKEIEEPETQNNLTSKNMPETTDNKKEEQPKKGFFKRLFGK